MEAEFEKKYISVLQILLVMSGVSLNSHLRTNGDQISTLVNLMILCSKFVFSK